MPSRVSKIWGRSSSGIPMMSPMTVIGSTSATSPIQSPPPAASSPSIIDAARDRMPSSSLAMARGVKAWDIARRRLVRSGGSMLMMVGIDATTPIACMSGPSTAVNESVSRWMRTACRCLVVIQKSRRTVFGHAVGELVVKDRCVAAQLGEQLIGKTVPLQRGIR
jgi:hypothetical protein